MHSVKEKIRNNRAQKKKNIRMTSFNVGDIYEYELKVENDNYLYIAEAIQALLFDLTKINNKVNAKNIEETYRYIPNISNDCFQLHNRRYIGSKYKLIEWIFSIIQKECPNGKSFADIFAGTGVVSAVASKHYDEIIINDFLYSNHVIYQAFFGQGEWDKNKVNKLIYGYNNITPKDLKDNYFSRSYGGKYFNPDSAKVIGFIRENIEESKDNLTAREYNILLASLLYSADKVANTVGHYDAYFKKGYIKNGFLMKPIEPIRNNNAIIFREDTNLLAKKIKTDIVYIDPPYNSRQYSRFYHVLETLIKWDNPTLYGTALKPEPENMSDYCRVQAKNKFRELVNDINAKYIVVSYNNTYESKSNSSKNKISLQEIENILKVKGSTNIFEKEYRHFNAGNTDFNNHKEYLFVTKTKNGK